MTFAIGASPPNSTWTDERIDKLKTLHANGMSASQIAKALGGVTRNAVIGKVTRLKLGGRELPSNPRAASPAREPRRPPASKPRPLPQIDVAPPPAAVRVASDGSRTYAMPPPGAEATDIAPGLVAGLGLSISDPRFRGCRWPVRGEGADMRFCCLPSGGETFCPEHAVRAYQPKATQARHSAKELLRSVRRFA